MQIKSKNYPSQEIYSRDELLYKHLYQIPPKNGRYIVLDTETTGLKKEDHIIEIGAVEIINGNLTGDQYHIYIKPRLVMEERVINLHGISNKFYDNYYKDIYISDKQNLLNFSKWVGNSIIFAHNAPFDMNAINRELFFWGLHEIPIKKYRCSMRIFREIISKTEPLYDEKYTSLEKCCEYFGLKSNEKIFHNALFDSYMTARLVCKLYEKIDSDPELYKDFDYNKQESLEAHYYIYKKQNLENQNFIMNNNFNNEFYYSNGSYLFPTNKSKDSSEEKNKNNFDINKNKLSNENENKNDNINIEGNKENNNLENKNIINNKEKEKEQKQEQIDLPNEILNEIFKELDSENI